MNLTRDRREEDDRFLCALMIARGKAPTCYCGADMVMLTTRYGRMWKCVKAPACDGQVGAHEKSGEPLGTPANKATRQARIRAHGAFDALWKGRDRAHRRRMYTWLATQLALGEEACHIAMFDAATCARVIGLCTAELQRRDGR